MEETFDVFYRTLDRTKFKYFIRGDACFVHNNDILLLPDELRPKGEKVSSARIQNIEQVVKYMLVTRKVPVEEYNGYELTRRGFPGDFRDFMDICVDDSIVPTIFAVSGTRPPKIQAAFIRDSRILVTEFEDDDLFSHLFSLMSTNNCIEVLYSDPSLERVFSGWGISCLLFKGKDSVEMLKKYMKIDLVVERFDRPDCCLVNIKDFDLVDFGLSTKQGRRLLSQWLRSPCVSIQEIQKRLDMSECFSRISVDVGSFGDLKRIASRISTRKITIQETIKMARTVEQIPHLVDSIKHSGLLCNENRANDNRLSNKAKALEEDFVSPLERIFNVFAPLVDELKEKIDFGQGKIDPGLTEELSLLESAKIEVYKDIEGEYLRIKEKFPRVKFSNKSFRIPRSEYNQAQFDSANCVVVSLLKTGAYFVTRNLSICKERLDEITNKMEIAESFIFDQIKSSMLRFVGPLESLNYIISLMDIYMGFSAKVKSSSYSRPVFDGRRYSIRGMFHPMIEHKECIVNDIDFDKSTCVLTGPNMGGKSTFIKALSMVSLYAQIGCYVPAKSAVLPIFDKIFLRVGAKDCSSQKLSTFMVEMVELNKILRTATASSLVLIDELGRGTSAVDGLSLASAVKEHLIKLGAKTVMASHFSELGGSDTLNKKMSVKGNVLTYKVEDGVCDTSFGISVAELVNFPKEVVDKAKYYLSTK